MTQKDNLPKKYQYIYDGMKEILTPEAFAVWYQNALEADKATPLPMPENPIKPRTKTNTKDAVAIAREAVSGYSTTNGARKAVEALANVIEQII